MGFSLGLYAFIMLLMFYLAETARDEPFLISQLVRIANLKQCQRVVWEGLASNRWSDPQLAAIQKQFASVDLLAAMKRSNIKA